MYLELRNKENQINSRLQLPIQEHNGMKIGLPFKWGICELNINTCAMQKYAQVMAHFSSYGIHNDVTYKQHYCSFAVARQEKYSLDIHLYFSCTS